MCQAVLYTRGPERTTGGGEIEPLSSILMLDGYDESASVLMQAELGAVLIGTSRSHVEPNLLE